MKQQHGFSSIVHIPAWLGLVILMLAIVVFPQQASADGPDIVISQVYGGGGNQDSLFTNDFIELFNRSKIPVSLAGWSVQATSETGDTWQTTALNGTIQPGHYVLIGQAGGPFGLSPLPPVDIVGTMELGASSGKVALVSSTDALTGHCPLGSTVDFIGYGFADCSEGWIAPDLNNKTANVRDAQGCIDTNDNNYNFFALPPAPRNANSPAVDCDQHQVSNRTVGDGTPASCTEEAFDKVLAFLQTTPGTFLNFNCGGPATIVFTSEKKISVNPLVIEGAGKITLDGAGATRLFRVSGLLALQDIILTNGNSGTAHGGSIVVDTGAVLRLERSTISASLTRGGAGAAIIDFNGSVTLIDSLITGSFGSYGALNSTGSLTLIRTTLRHNRADFGGGAISAGGTVNITDSLFEDNWVPFGGGGALYLTSSAVTTIKNSTFNENYSSNIDPSKNAGGAILNFGSLTIDNNRFYQNTAEDGSAIRTETSSSLTITHSTFDHNQDRGSSSAQFKAQGGAISAGVTSIVTVQDTMFTNNSTVKGGAIYFSGSQLSVQDSLFQENAAQNSGGAISALGGDLAISRSEFTSNTAKYSGGAIRCKGATLSITESGLAFNSIEGSGGAIDSACELSLSNSTLSDNVAEGGESSGSAIFHNGPHQAIIRYTTITGNNTGTSYSLVNYGNGASINISRSLLTGTPAGNCAGAITSDGYNFSDDASCSSFTNTGDKLNANLPLSPYGNNGGQVGSRIPLSGNEAIDAIPIAQCLDNTDQRQGSRPTGSGCDSGAIEVGSVIFDTYLPLTVH